MPKTTKQGNAKSSELPSTIARSDDKAQRTFAKAHDSAFDEYGSEERAHRVAFSALKHTHEKVGDHWEPKGHKGPSDERAASGGPNASGRSAEGVDANATKEHLAHIARGLDISGRSTMTKGELVQAIRKANRRASAASRSKETTKDSKKSDGKSTKKADKKDRKSKKEADKKSKKKKSKKSKKKSKK